MTLVSGLVSGTSCSLVQGLVGAGAAEPFVPGPVNSGAVDFDAASLYSTTVSGAGADGNTASIVVWVYLTASATQSIIQMGFDFTSGKTTAFRTPLWITQRATGGIRIEISGSKGVTFRGEMPVPYVLNEWNMYAIGVDIAGAYFPQAHWSPTSGLSSGTYTPSINTAQPIEWSNVVDVTIGSSKTVTGYNQYFGGNLAQAFVAKNIYDFDDTAIQDLIIDASNYYNAQRLEQGIIAHSGNRSTFAPNAGTLYSTLTVTDTALADAAGPTPPFVL